MGASLSKGITIKSEGDVNNKILLQCMINLMKENVQTRIAKFRHDVELGGTEGDKFMKVDKIVGAREFFQTNVDWVLDEAPVTGSPQNQTTSDEEDVPGNPPAKLKNNATATSEKSAVDGARKVAVPLVDKGEMGNRILKESIQAIKDMLTSSVAVVHEKRNYFPSIDETGGIYRLDVIYITYSLGCVCGSIEDSRGFNIVAGCIIKSSASMEGMNRNTLRVIVNYCYDDKSANERLKLFSALTNAAPGGDLETDETQQRNDYELVKTLLNEENVCNVCKQAHGN